MGYETMWLYKYKRVVECQLGALKAKGKFRQKIILFTTNESLSYSCIQFNCYFSTKL